MPLQFLQRLGNFPLLHSRTIEQQPNGKELEKKRHVVPPYPCAPFKLKWPTTDFSEEKRVIQTVTDMASFFPQDFTFLTERQQKKEFFFYNE